MFGKGRTKKLAKQAAAEAALHTFIQLPEMRQVPYQQQNTNIDFTSDESCMTNSPYNALKQESKYNTSIFLYGIVIYIFPWNFICVCSAPEYSFSLALAYQPKSCILFISYCLSRHKTLCIARKMEKYTTCKH